MTANPDQDFVLKTIKSRDVHFVRFWFTDVLGAMKSFAVVPGELSYRAPGKEWRTAAVSEGMVKVEGNDILVLVDSAEYPEEIDAKRAQRAADEAKEAILQKRSVREYRTAQANLARAINRLRVKKNAR